MENCNTGINIPTTTTAPCEGNQITTDCIATDNSIIYLDLAAGATQTQINAAIVTALTFKDEQIAELQSQLNALDARLIILETL